MDPFTMGLILSAGSGLFGAYSKNKQQGKNNKRMAGLDARAQGMMGQGPGAGEGELMKFLMQGFDPAQFTGEGFNMGQDSLMQMLRADPIDSSAMFSGWEPMEKRQLDSSLNNFWGSASSLGQRFGSSAARETGRIRGEAAENAIGRRAETGVDLAKFNQQQKMGAATQLQNSGSNMAQMALQAWQAKAGGLQGVAGMEQQRRNADMQLLAMMMGMPMGGGENAFAETGGEFGQLLMMLPMLQEMMKGGKRQWLDPEALDI